MVRSRDGYVRPMPPTLVTDWFLTARERGNPATEIDRRRGDGKSWTEGNRVELLVDGAEYFRRLHQELSRVEAGDWVHLTDWHGDLNERLDGPGTELGTVLRDLARRGVHVRGLLWRSHPRQAHFGEQDNSSLAQAVNDAGGELLLDERVRRDGSHHQKLVLIRRAHVEDDVAFVGGIDLCHGRRDDHDHRGDPQSAELSPECGERPPWRLTHQPRHPDPLPPARLDPPVARTCAVQVCGRIRPSDLPSRSRPRVNEASVGRTRRRGHAHAV